MYSNMHRAGTGSGGMHRKSQYPGRKFQDMDDFYRAFTSRQDFFGRTSPGFAFSFDGPFGQQSSPFKAPMFWKGGSLKSVYIQKVSMPLQDLYKGQKSVNLTVKDSIWKSYTAAFRGGIGYLVLYQSLVFGFPMLRMSRRLTLLVIALIFHANAPRPGTLQYTADIRAGTKGGTKIIFRGDSAEAGFDIVFLLEEEKNLAFKRVGNDLHTNVDILMSQAKNGCTLEIQLLDPAEPPAVVKLGPKQIKSSGESVAIKNKVSDTRLEGANLVFKVLFLLAKLNQLNPIAFFRVGRYETAMANGGTWSSTLSLFVNCQQKRRTKRTDFENHHPSRN